MQAHGQSVSVLAPASQAVDIPDHEMLCLIGRGAYGEVWMARNAIGTMRAVKVVHRESFQHPEDFEREFKGLLKFEPISRSHDGLVDILQIGRRDDAGVSYYVMELADDAAANRNSDLYLPHTLRSELQSRGRLPPADCVTLGLKLAAALEHLHVNGLVHRDVKPSNIIFVAGEPKLADIGLVTAIGDAHSLVGTVGYIPPEGPGTPQADLYSLGKVLYEIAFGKARQEFPQLPLDLQSHPDYATLLELNEVILKACETDPRRRYSSAQAMQADLALLQTGRSVKQARTRERHWAAARKLSFAGAVVALVIAAFPFLKSKTGHTPTAEAARLYDYGRWYYSQLTVEGHKKALKFLTEATEKDPKFVQPYAELTALYTWNQLPGITNEEIRLQKVQEIANKALATAPNSAEAHTALSWCRFLQRDWRGAEAEIKRAIKFNPNLALAHDIYCFYLSMQGRVEEAIREGQLSAKQPPVSQRASAIIAAWPFMAERRFDLAIAQLKGAVELDPKFWWGHSYLGTCYEASSNYLAAIEECKTADLVSDKDPTKVAATYAAMRQAYETGGQEAYFRKWIELIEADQALPEDKRNLDFDYRDVAGYYAQLGEKEKAFKLLEEHFDEPQVWHEIKFLPMYDPLHDEPRFKALVKRAGLEP